MIIAVAHAVCAQNDVTSCHHILFDGIHAEKLFLEQKQAAVQNVTIYKSMPKI